MSINIGRSNESPVVEPLNVTIGEQMTAPSEDGLDEFRKALKEDCAKLASVDALQAKLDEANKLLLASANN